MQQAQGSPWTLDDYQYLYEHYNSDGADRCAIALNRSPGAISAKAEKLKLVPQGNYTEAELKIVRNYQKVLGTALIFLLPNRTAYEIEDMIKCVKR